MAGHAMKIYSPSVNYRFIKNGKIESGLKSPKCTFFETRKDMLMKLWTLVSINILCNLKIFSGP